MKIGNREFDMSSRTYVMGILNVTPDSFSDGGKYRYMDEALKHAQQMVEDGADILDVGGESTRPGHQQISEDEEIERVVPVIEKIKKCLDIPVSLDTYKSRVAKAGIEAGADLINDIWGLKYDEDMAKVIAHSGLPCCLMHNRESPDYNDYLTEVKQDLSVSADIAGKAGIEEQKIILDPGIGFGKTYNQNLLLIKHLEIVKELGYPVLLGTSKKSCIGLTLNLPVERRMEGTLATTVFGVMKGCNFVRVHDVKENVRAIKMTEAILQA